MALRIVKALVLVTLWMGTTFGLQAQTVVEYIHTDALGTPVAITNAAGTVIERSVYEPNGQLINRPLTDGPGFTGHVQDAATGLTYMQQRYYDPIIGRFLSVDPVAAYGGDPRHFNRYTYGYNNPYSFTDPDGRAALAVPVIVGGGIICLRSSWCRTTVKAAVVTAAAYVGSRLLTEVPDAPDSESAEGETESGDGGRVKTPNSGEPGSVAVNPNNRQERLYGEDGLPELDVDYNHDHGQGAPHDHEWTRDADGRPVRGPAKPSPKRDEPPTPKRDEPPKPKPEEEYLGTKNERVSIIFA